MMGWNTHEVKDSEQDGLCDPPFNFSFTRDQDYLHETELAGARTFSLAVAASDLWRASSSLRT